MMKNEDSKRFCQRLDEHHQWPCSYMFKFILPATALTEFTDLFPNESIQFRESRNGKYTSVTMELNMESSQAVMGVYEKAATVPGIMSL